MAAAGRSGVTTPSIAYRCPSCGRRQLHIVDAVHYCICCEGSGQVVKERLGRKGSEPSKPRMRRTHRTTKIRMIKEPA